MTDATRALLEHVQEFLHRVTHWRGCNHEGVTDLHDMKEAVKAALDQEPATAPPTPAWHDAPTEPGLWMCNEGDDNPYRWTTHRVTFPLNQLLVGEDERWYGPIPQDAAIAKAEGRTE